MSILKKTEGLLNMYTHTICSLKKTGHTYQRHLDLGHPEIELFVAVYTYTHNNKVAYIS